MDLLECVTVEHTKSSLAYLLKLNRCAHMRAAAYVYALMRASARTYFGKSARMRADARTRAHRFIHTRAAARRCIIIIKYVATVKEPEKMK